MIDHYRFGEIEIEGERYTKDVEVRDDGEVLSWWREEGHVFHPQDLERALKEDPSVIVLGTGAEGVAQVPKETVEHVKGKGVTLVIDKTDEAVKAFNKLLEKEKGRVIGLFHLTC